MASDKPAIRRLERLIEGNERFVREVDRTVGAADRPAFLSAQHPLAVVLTCADARVVPELIFDQSIGRLFVIRVAGNVAGPAELGSIEYAIDRFDCPLVVVLGHTQCGAVSLAMPDPPDDWTPDAIVAASPNVRALLDPIGRSLDPFEEVEPAPPDEAWRQAVEWNVRSVVDQIAASSVSLVAAVAQHRTVVVGAVYDVESGEVEFLDE